MSAPARDRERETLPVPDRREALTIAHYQNAEHLANERTHLAYLRTAIAVMSLGIAMNRFGLYVFENDKLLPARPLRLLRDTSQIGAGMVLFGFAWLVVALHRYRRVERAIDRRAFLPQRRLIEWLTLSAVLGAALGIVWLFLR